MLRLLLTAALLALATAQTSDAPSAAEQQQMLKAQEELLAAKKAKAQAEQDAQDGLDELRSYVETLKAKQADPEAAAKELQDAVEDKIRSRKSQLTETYEAALGHLQKAATNFTFASSGSESLSAYARTAIDASKELQTLEKEKAKGTRQQISSMQKAAMAKAKALYGKVKKAAKLALTEARKAKLAGRSAGLPESQYEGELEEAEHFDEKLEQTGEHLSEKAEGAAEHVYEKIESILEHSADHASDKAQDDHEQRVEQVQHLLEQAQQLREQPPEGARPVGFLATRQEAFLASGTAAAAGVAFAALSVLGLVALGRRIQADEVLLGRPALG